MTGKRQLANTKQNRSHSCNPLTNVLTQWQSLQEITSYPYMGYLPEWTCHLSLIDPVISLMSVRIFSYLSFTLVILPVRGQCGMQMKGAAFIIKEKVLKSIPCPFRIYKLCGPLLISQPRRNSPSPITPVGNCAIQTTGDMAW